MLQTSSSDSCPDFPLIMGQALADREDLHMALIDRSGFSPASNSESK